ncbi:DUF3800 domain-containing protein [Ruminococcus flavefaciens]|uniref:DUF3800 domain-containing protein n=1 Tax=Ruminococcus flavefaciens TaxID=1265 RepID=UPI0026F0CC8B|nr:DUF3800 domain-containing protein [Ruminococcus flavefaciens]MDD7518114.1 DUF3800 domain-containing protein [Ruminococcus flavefaciens]MDY5690787.1 DUF3800 domain-containing protein [Ruminococcus flavefaciens]
MFNFYYDESEHSRIINLSTITGETYYDNFLVAIVGWDSDKEVEIKQKYLAFEEKYAERKKKGELKSDTFKSNQFKYGFASFNKPNVEMLNDLLSIIDDDFFIYLFVASKIEYVIIQLFKDYTNSIFVDMDSVRYSIVKAILTYRPTEVINSIYAEPEEFVSSLIDFFTQRIELNKSNIALKEAENNAFENILMILQDVEPPTSINWDYHMSFEGFSSLLKSKRIADYSLTIDKEGNSKTHDAAIEVGIVNCTEVDSKEHFGLRIADMLAGIVGKMMKSLYHSLRNESNNATVTKTLLDKSWFKVSEEQLYLYKKLHHILLEINNDWYKIYAGNYSDDLISLLALLDYMNHFKSADEIQKDFDMHPEYCNACMCRRLEEHFNRIHSKMPVEPVVPETEEYFRNSRGAKVYFDINKQPKLQLEYGEKKLHVLSVGRSKEGIPLVTIASEPENLCLRLPYQLDDWVIWAVGMAMQGEKRFPADVIFSKTNDGYYADIL